MGLARTTGPPGRARVREDHGHARHGAHGGVQASGRSRRAERQVHAEGEGGDDEQDADVEQVGGPDVVAAAVPGVHGEPRVHEQARRHRRAHERQGVAQDEGPERRPLRGGGHGEGRPERHRRDQHGPEGAVLRQAGVLAELPLGAPGALVQALVPPPRAAVRSPRFRHTCRTR